MMFTSLNYYFFNISFNLINSYVPLVKVLKILLYFFNLFRLSVLSPETKASFFNNTSKLTNSWTTKLWEKTEQCMRICWACSVWFDVTSGLHRKWLKNWLCFVLHRRNYLKFLYRTRNLFYRLIHEELKTSLLLQESSYLLFLFRWITTYFI